MARVAPEVDSSENQSHKSSNKSISCSSALTGKEIGPNQCDTDVITVDENKLIKSSYYTRRGRKHLPRSVSEVVEEKEKQEKNVFTRFGIRLMYF